MAWRVAADCGANKIAEARRARGRQLKTSGFEISRLHGNEISCMRENLVWRTFSSGPFRQLDRNTEPCAGFNIHQAPLRLQPIVASCPRGGRKLSKLILTGKSPKYRLSFTHGFSRVNSERGRISSNVSTVFSSTPRDETAKTVETVEEIPRSLNSPG